jgi:hypothetical protein
MSRIGPVWRHHTTQLAKSEKGAALIELAMAVPVLLVLILGGMELTNYVVVQMQINRIAGMTADNAARLRTPMSESFMNQLFTGVDKAGSSIHFTQHGRVIVSSVQNNSAGPGGSSTGQWIRWQRCWGNLRVNSKYGLEGKGQNDASLRTMNGLTAQGGSALIYAELYYDYQPIIPSGFFAPGRLIHETAFIVRQRTDYSISGAGAATC